MCNKYVFKKLILMIKYFKITLVYLILILIVIIIHISYLLFKKKFLFFYEEFIKNVNNYLLFQLKINQ